MKHSRYFLAALAMAVCLMSGISAAQMKLIADIPFDFTVGKNSLPAGQYTVTAVGPQVVLLRSWGERSNAMAICSPTRSSQYPAASKLEFHHVGERYFLSKVLPAGTGAGYHVPTSKEEDRLIRLSGQSPMRILAVNAIAEGRSGAK
jgi:hypothetical protein